MESKTTDDSIKRLNVDTLSGVINSKYFLYGTMGQPIVFFGFSSGKIFLISFHNGYCSCNACKRTWRTSDYLPLLFYPVTDANFDTPSYLEYQEGYWLARNGMKWFWDQFLSNDTNRKEPTVSPLQATVEQAKGLPPALIIFGEYDVLRDEVEAYAHKLMQAGVPTTATRYLGYYS